MVRILLQFDVSQIWTRPVLVPTARCVPLCVHATEDTASLPRSHSFVTCVNVHRAVRLLLLLLLLMMMMTMSQKTLE